MKLNSLTSLRFIAAAFIVIHHSQGVLWLASDTLRHFPFDQAVSFFFVLSGFVLTYAHSKLEGNLSVKRFYLARFARIWPNHLAAFVFWMIIFSPQSLSLLNTGGAILSATLNICLLQSWVPRADIFFSFNAVTWAISVEIFFYILFPVLIKNLEATWRSKLTLSVLIAIALVVFCNVMQIPAYDPNYSHDVSSAGIVYINPLANLFDFVLGMSAAFLWGKYSTAIKLDTTIGSIMELVAVCITLAAMYFTGFAFLLSGWIGTAGSAYVQHQGSTLFFAILISIMALQSGFISRFMQNRVFVLLGEASYAIFLFHQLLLRFYVANTDRFNFLPASVLYGAFWAVLLLLSLSALFLIERPARKFIMTVIPIKGTISTV